MKNYEYHRPIMLNECLDGLNIKPDGIYVDVTFGGGGHSKAILERLTSGKLFAFDQDEDAKKNAEQITHPGFTFIQANFRYLKKFLRVYGIKKADGILADLGVSSHQIDTPERGFSTRFEADLDMRMNQKGTITARKVINEYSERDLHKVLGMYGEIKNARTAASEIIRARSGAEIKTIEDLKNAIAPCTPRNKEFKYWAQVFQALRIEVNEEMAVLEEFLLQTPDVLNENGRLVVMSFHSLEDRMVKNFIRSGKIQGEIEKDFFGNILKPLLGISRKPIEASDLEKAENPRARSAKLRIAEKPIE
jgi:16S rRNA (cytosine1402-N4)-methyltransferase